MDATTGSFLTSLQELSVASRGSYGMNGGGAAGLTAQFYGGRPTGINGAPTYARLRESGGGSMGINGAPTYERLWESHGGRPAGINPADINGAPNFGVLRGIPPSTESGLPGKKHRRVKTSGGSV